MTQDTPTRILLIEDSPSDVRLVEELLHQSSPGSFTILTAATLSQGLDLLSANSVDVILLDLGLPDSHGLDTFHTVYQHASHLPVIVLTVSDDEVLGERVLEEGAQRFISKDAFALGETYARIFARTIRFAMEQKRAEAARTTSEEQLQALFEFSPVVQIRYDPDGSPIAINHAARQFLGIDDVRAIQHLTVFTSTRVSDADKARLRAGKPARYEQIYDFDAIKRQQGGFHTTKSGIRYVDFSIAPIFGAEGKLEAYLGQFVDITERKGAEDALKASHEEVQALNEEIQSSNEELRSANEELEQRVQERTEELASMNEELKVANEELRHEVEHRTTAEQTIRTQAQHTTLLNKIIRRGNTTTDAQDFLQYVCDLLVKEYGYDACDMRIIIDKEDIAEQIAVTGFPGEFNKQFRYMSIDDPVLRGVYHGKPYFPSRYAKTHVDLVRATGMASIGIVPLAVGETIIGDMGVALKDYRPFSPDEQVLLISVGRETGTVLARLQAEEAAMQRAAMLDGVHDAVIMRDVNDHITYWNDGAERLYGWTRDEALGTVIHDLLKTKFPAPFDQIKSTLIETGRWEGELIHKTKAGATITVESHKTLQRAPDGAPVATLEINNDITELKQYADHLEDLVAQRTVQLKEAERLAAIGQTATMIGHDLRNPLQAMQLIVNLAEKYYNDISPEAKARFDSATADRIFSSVEKQIQYMDKIVSDLQDYARPLTVEPKTVHVSAFVTDTLALLTIPEPISVNVDVHDALTATVDPHLMQRALSNLMMNAVQAMPQGGELTIGATAEDHAVVIRIHDTGEGVPENMKETLFSPLTTGKAKGTGLGLAVVKRIIEAHGGTITFTSDEGKGTTFIVTLPQKAV